MIKKEFKLNNGEKIPAVGLGTWKINGRELVKKAIEDAIDVGYRHIDTAYIYENEKHIGEVLNSLLKEGKIKREDLFITSKLWNTFHKDPEEGLDQSLKDLQLEYVDLYLVHWPVTFERNKGEKMVKLEQKFKLEEYDAAGLWKRLEALVKKGKARSLGLANHGIKTTTEVLNTCTIKPTVAQFECHPYLPQEELIQFAKKHDIQVVSYSSLGSGPAVSELNIQNEPLILHIADKHKITPSQVILSYLVQCGMCVIPKSTNRDHMVENMMLTELDSEDIERIKSISIRKKYVDPEPFGKDRFN